MATAVTQMLGAVRQIRVRFVPAFPRWVREAEVARLVAPARFVAANGRWELGWVEVASASSTVDCHTQNTQNDDVIAIRHGPCFTSNTFHRTH